MESLDAAGVVSIRPIPIYDKAKAEDVTTALQFVGITFHPTRPVAYFATQHAIYAYDLSLSALLGHVRVATNERITHVLSSATHPFLIAAIDSGLLYVWDQNSFSLLMVLQTAAKEELDCVMISMTSPVIYYTRPGLREVGTVDIMKGPPIKLDLGRKGAACLAVHPSKPEVACGCADGHVKFWDTAGKVSAGVDDFATMQTANNKSAAVAGIAHLAFDPLQHNLVAASTSGLVVIWSLGKQMKVLGSRKLVNDVTLLSLSFHARHPLFFVLTSNGQLSSWTYLKTPKEGNTIVSGSLAISDLGAKEEAARHANMPSYLLPSSATTTNPISFRAHPKLNYVAFLFPVDASFGGNDHMHQHAIYSLSEDYQSSYSPPTIGYNFPWQPDVDDPVTFLYPSELYYLAKTNVLNAYLPAHCENVLKKKIPDVDSEGTIVRPLRIAHNPHTDRFLILSVPNQQYMSAHQLLTASNNSPSNAHAPPPPATRAVLWHPSAPDSFSARPARDACWAAESSDHLLLLADFGRRAELLQATAEKPISAAELTEAAARVFSTPLSGGVVLYYLPDSNALVYSANISPARPKNEPAYSLSTHPSDRFQLLPEEVVLHVNWHPSALFFALITSHRALLLDKDLTLLSSFVFPTNHTRPFCSNALWAGAALLLSITTHVVYMTLDGTVRPLASLEQPGAVLMAVFNDKIVYATSNRTNTEIRAQPIGLLEPLVSGQLAYDAWRRTPSAVTAVHLSRIISRFDCARVSEQVYNSLQQAGFPDAAASLLAAAPSPPANALYNAAVNALRFDLAYTLQKEKKVPDITISELGRACVAYGQFETARRVYELSGNFLALLQLYGSCGNRPGVEMLLERAKKDEALKSYIPVVERVLKIRSFGSSPTLMLSNWRIQSALREYDTTPVTAAIMTTNYKAPEFVQPYGRLETLDKYMASLHDRFAAKDPRTAKSTEASSGGEAIKDEKGGKEEKDKKAAPPMTLPEPVNRAPPARTISERAMSNSAVTHGTVPVTGSVSSSASISSPSKDTGVITLAAPTGAVIPTDTPLPAMSARKPPPGSLQMIPSGELLTPLRQPPFKRSLNATSSTLSIRRSPSEDDLVNSDSDADAPPHEDDDDFDDEGPEEGSSQSDAPIVKAADVKSSDPPTPVSPRSVNISASQSGEVLPQSPSLTSPAAASPATTLSPEGTSSSLLTPEVSPQPTKHHKRHSHHRSHSSSHHRSPSTTSPAPSPMTLPAAAAIEQSPSGGGSGIGSVLRASMLSDETLMELEKSLSADSDDPIISSLMSGLAKLEKGNFAPALEDIENTIRTIAGTNDIESQKTLMRLSVAYKLALKLLIEIKLLEKDPSGDKTRIAVFAKLLSDTRLLPKHRVICARMAINKNLDVNNFGVAGRLLQSLVPLQLPDQATTESRLKKCEEEKFQDSSLPAPYICPSCNSSVSVGASLCPTCNRTPYFCALSWVIMSTKFCHGCSFCGALYHPEVLLVNAKCPFCCYGQVEKHSILS